MNKSLAYVLLFMLNSFAFSQTSDFYSYHIGNSLTWDANPPSFKNIAAHAGYTQEVGYQIVPGQPLNYIWNNPADYAEAAEPYTTFDNALPNYTWDAVTFQPFSGGGSTLGTDKQVILNMIDMALQNSANYNTQFYIYAAYPNQTVTTEDADGLTIDYSSEGWRRPAAKTARRQFAHVIIIMIC